MLYVNKEYYSKTAYKNKIDALHATYKNTAFSNVITALCLNHPFELLCLLHYIVFNGGSVLLIDPQNPPAETEKKALAAKCRYLFYHNPDHPIRLDNYTTINEPAIYQFSSGSTGEPKLIGRTWLKIQEEIKHYNHRVFAQESLKPILLVPVSHSYGLVAGLLCGLARQEEVITVDANNPKMMGAVINNNPKAIIYGVPFLFQLLVSLKSMPLSFYHIVSSGAPLNSSLLSELKHQSRQVIQQYGSTETGCISVKFNPALSSDIGTPLDHFKISVSKDKANPDEIKVLYKDKIICTKDIGYMDAGDSLHITGRLDDVINIGGLKVFPYEVENVIGSLDTVAEAAVFKNKHQTYAESLCALVVPRHCRDRESNQNLEKSVREECIKKLAAYMVPATIRIVDEIPKLKSGKIDRKIL